MWFDLDSGPVIHQGLDLPVVPPRQIHLITGTLRSKLSAVSFVACRGTLLSSRGSKSRGPLLDCLTWHLSAVPFIIVCIYCNERAGYFVKSVIKSSLSFFRFFLSFSSSFLSLLPSHATDNRATEWNSGRKHFFLWGGVERQNCLRIQVAVKETEQQSSCVTFIWVYFIDLFILNQNLLMRWSFSRWILIPQRPLCLETLLSCLLVSQGHMTWQSVKIKLDHPAHQAGNTLLVQGKAFYKAWQASIPAQCNL